MPGRLSNTTGILQKKKNFVDPLLRKIPDPPLNLLFKISAGLRSDSRGAGTLIDRSDLENNFIKKLNAKMFLNIIAKKLQKQVDDVSALLYAIMKSKV